MTSYPTLTSFFLTWFRILGIFWSTLLQVDGTTDFGLAALNGPKPFGFPNDARTKYLWPSFKLSTTHSSFWPSSLLQTMTFSPAILAKVSDALHWTLNFVNREYWPTGSGSPTCTLKEVCPVTLAKTLEGACGQPLASKPVNIFLRLTRRLCQRVCCFSHSFSWAGVKLAAAAVEVSTPVEVPSAVAITLTGWLLEAALISWPNLSTWKPK